LKEYLDFSKGPLPDVEEKEGAPFWEGARQEELRFPRCRKCHRFHWYPSVLCPYCHSGDIEWQAVTSQPKLFSWTYVRHPFSPLFEIWGPHFVVLVEFEGVPELRLVTTLVDCNPEDVRIGMPLEVVFQRVNDKVTMPIFRPLKDTAS